MSTFTAVVNTERWPLRETFTIARGSKSVAEVVTVSVTDTATNTVGRGECVPYARYGEDAASVTAAITDAAAALPTVNAQAALQEMLPPGAARNALDCALWDWRAKRERRSVWDIAGIAKPKPVTSAFTLSLAEPQAMADAAARARHMPILKLKLDATDPAAAVAAVKQAAPDATLIVDANEAWHADTVADILNDLAALGVAMVEQPLPADTDAALAAITSPIPIAADESFHTAPDAATIATAYDIANIKLDKTGGLTAAIDAAIAVRKHGMGVMVGCMTSTSLSIAPALLLAGGAKWVDLDATVLLAKDRAGGIRWRDGVVEVGVGVWG